MSEGVGPRRGTRKALQADARLWLTPFVRHDLLTSTTEHQGRRSAEVISRWAKHAMQSVQMPATFEAALMATDSSAALVGEHLPWPAFEIQVSPGLQTLGDGEVVSVLVAAIEPLPGDPASVALELYDSNGNYNVSVYGSLSDLSHMDTAEHDTESGPSDAWTWDVEQVKRVWLVLGRLVGGVVLAINQARETDGGAYPLLVKRKRGELWATTHQLGRPLKLDCRQAVRDYVSGLRGRELTTQHLRRGHWRNQAHGPGSALRRRQWIQPCWVGEGPTLVRPVMIGTEHPRRT